MRIDVLTLFPQMFEPVLSASIPGRARAAGLVDWFVHDIRDHANNKHNKVDDRPFGGGPGMVMMCQPLWDAVANAESQAPQVGPTTRILLTPQGRPLTQTLVEDLASRPRLLMIAGHYEGVDERVIDALDPLEISIGDYVLSGGELPAMVLIDAIVRLLPGALGHLDSASRTASPTATRSMAVCSTARTTPVPASGRGGRSRRSSSAATTPRSIDGVWNA